MRLPDRQAIPLSDARALGGPARRLTVVRFALAVALVAALAGAVAFAQRPGEGDRALVKGADSGVVVLDLSASIGRPGRSVVDPFEYLADTGQEFGLVIFSGRAYEVLPPGTSSAELRPIIRALLPFPDVCLARADIQCPPDTKRVEPDSEEGERVRRLSVTPWDSNFRGGTEISWGLTLARNMLERHNMTQHGVLLISDLDDALLDIPRLTRELITFRQDDIPIHVVALEPFDDDRFFFERILGKEAFVDHADMTPGLDARRRAQRAGVPEGLAGLALILLTLLAVNEHFCGRLSWRMER
ncbi:MAG TPA: VWA domain-containing protein [Gaiellaceae bacterium]|nr:VWA domain-containing protein [Gaiellaceae bacterium]